MEFEKKYLLEDPPEDLYESPSFWIEQVYLIAAGDEELRVRSKGDRFRLTLKKGSGSARQEVEIPITEEQYGEFAEQSVGEAIHKKRIEYPYRGLTIEVDVYQGHLEGLAVAEVEFSSQESMDEFSPPAWLGEDISSSEEFKNRSLAMEGFPTWLRRKWKSGTRPAWHYRQSGVVPLRSTQAGHEVLMVTSRGAGRWIVPKGIVELYLSPADSAVKEAREEAGATGTLVAGISETYSFDKWNGTCTVILFPLIVEALESPWAEDDVRERRWFGREEIERQVENAEMKSAIARILDSLPVDQRVSSPGSRPPGRGEKHEMGA